MQFTFARGERSERERERAIRRLRSKEENSTKNAAAVRPSVDSLFEERVGAGWDGEEDDVAV